MNCEEALAILTGKLAGQVEAADDAEAERHLHACLACRREWEALTATWMLLRDLPLEAPDPAVAAQLFNRIARQIRWQWLLPRAAGLAAAGAFLTVGLIALVPFKKTIVFCLGLLAGAPTQAPADLAAFFVAGLPYGLLPLLVATVLFWRWSGLPRLRWWGWGLFNLVTLPYVAIRCSEFSLELTLMLLLGFVAGAWLGGIGGGWVYQLKVTHG